MRGRGRSKVRQELISTLSVSSGISELIVGSVYALLEQELMLRLSSGEVVYFGDLRIEIVRRGDFRTEVLCERVRRRGGGGGDGWR